jgi:hypothetical protein
MAFTLQKNWDFAENSMFSVGLNSGLLFGKYRGVELKPIRDYFFSPSLKLSKEGRIGRASINYSFLRFDNENISNHRIGIELLVKLNFD